jgi:hypothetical protein
MVKVIVHRMKKGETWVGARKKDKIIAKQIE